MVNLNPCLRPFSCNLFCDPKSAIGGLRTESETDFWKLFLLDWIRITDRLSYRFLLNGIHPKDSKQDENKIIPLGEKHLRLAIREYTEHYHRERNHQGLDSRIILEDDSVGRSEGDIKKRSRLGGFLNYYFREAAWGSLLHSVVFDGSPNVAGNRLTLFPKASV